MPYVLRHKAGKLAVYNTPDVTNPADGPIDDPDNHLPDLAFHSDWRYPAFLPAKIVTGTSTIPAQGANSDFNGLINLYAHGMGDVPVVFGEITSVAIGTYTFPAREPAFAISTPVPWSGAVPVIRRTDQLGGQKGYVTFVQLMADATHVKMRYGGLTGSASTMAQNAITVGWKIQVLDSTINGTQFAGDPTKPLLELLGDRITAGRRKFDTNNAYMRLNSGVDQVAIVRGETMVIKGNPNIPSVSSTDNGWGWRYSVAGHTFEAGQGSSGFTAAYDMAGF